MTFAMSNSISKAPSTGYSEFVVEREFFNRYSSKPIPKSTFHDFVKKGIIIPMKDLKGHFLLNESLRRLDLRDIDHARLPAERHRESIDADDHVLNKIAYKSGVVDAQFMLERAVGETFRL